MGLKEIPKCKMCGGNIIVEVVRQNKEYPIYCSLYCSNKSVEHKENRERTNIKKYGFKSCLQNNSIRNKIQQTMLQRYGVKYTGQSQQLMEKVEKTNLKKYGCRSCLGSKSIRNKIEKTMIMKYGCKNPMQHTVIQNNVKRKYIYNNIYFDSQVEIATYIYFRENNISFEYHPNVSFEYFYSGKRHLYFPDFVVNGEYVEIKGSQFFENKDETKRMICPYNRRKDDLFEEKHKCMILNKVKIITEKKYVVFLKYVHKKYGKKYLRQFKI